ncbi:MAG: succinylglutamate desuccinylase/aspartoacylase family protein [Burkholderiaceae bacterium]|nr:succinylglutamate desuccinylase/aspartoacylase family protein [Burkholderiaceae bacterium]
MAEPRRAQEPVVVPAPADAALAPDKASPTAPSTKPHAQSTTPSACKMLLVRMPSVSQTQCEAAQLVPSGAVSVKGIPLYVRDVPAPTLTTAFTPAKSSPSAALKPGTEQPMHVLIVGAIHGDELTAASLALRWIALAQQDGMPVHWRFVPVLNPDGLLAQPATRVNAHGVDLNRNFPTPGWAQDAPVYWEKRTRRDPRRWPGKQPLSEPESQFLHAQMAQFKPDLIVSVHAPYGVLDFDGPQAPPERLGRLWLDQVGVFPGSLGHYGGVHRGIPVVTIELPNAQRMPRPAEVTAMWNDLLRWMAAHWAQVQSPLPDGEQPRSTRR